MLTNSQIELFGTINAKIRAEEIRARNYLLNLIKMLDAQIKAGEIDDYEIEHQFSIWSDNEQFCANKNVEIGNPFYQTNLYNLHPEYDDLFEMDWYVSGMKHIEQVKHFHIGYLMHCLIDHTDLVIEDLLAIDDVWIEFIVRYQFWTDKKSDSVEK